MKFLSKFLAITVLIMACVIPNYGCVKKVPLIEGRAQIDFKWDLYSERTKTRWLEISGDVVNRGTKRADWVEVTIYTIDENTGVVVDRVSQYVEGSGSHGSSVESGAEATFTIRVNTKIGAPYTYERDVIWIDAP